VSGDLDRIEEVRILPRLMDKYRHLAQSINYLGDEISLLDNTLRTLEQILREAKKTDIGRGEED